MKHPRESSSQSSLSWLSSLWCIRSSAVYYCYCGAALTSSFKIQYLMWWCDDVMWRDVSKRRTDEMIQFEVIDWNCLLLIDWLTDYGMIDWTAVVLPVVSSYLLTCWWVMSDVGDGGGDTWYWWRIAVVWCTNFNFSSTLHVAPHIPHPASFIALRDGFWLASGRFLCCFLLVTRSPIPTVGGTVL